MEYKRLDLKNNTTITEDHFKHIEDGISITTSVLKDVGIQNICDTTKFHLGYYNQNNSATGWGVKGSNASYNVIFIDVELNTGDIITIWTKDGKPVTARFISAFDNNKNKNTTLGASDTQIYTVPEGIKFIAVTVRSTSGTDIVVQKSNKSTWLGYVEPLKQIYKVDGELIDGNVTSNNDSTPTLHVYLPSELCIPQGYTIELYNRQACLEWERYHIQWIGKYGTCYERKYSISAGENQELESFDLTLNVLNDDLEILVSKKCKCHIVSKDITNEQVIIPIGDSLTNNKYWQKHLQTFSNSKIQFRGTRGHKNNNFNASDYQHEGRSGAGTGWYNKGTSVYDFDVNCIPAITESGSYNYLVKANGDSIDPRHGNPFWHRTEDGSIDKFDFDFYCNTQSEGGAGLFYTSDGTPQSITPTGVIIYLGANGIALDGSTAGKNIKELVTLIRSSEKGKNIPLYIVNDAFRAPYIAYTNSDGFNTNVSGEYGYLNDLKHMNLEISLYDALKNETNVFFMPICATFDSEYNYPFTEIGVNPYTDEPKMRKYTDTQHPANSSSAAGYKQMAVTMYGVISKHTN